MGYSIKMAPFRIVWRVESEEWSEGIRRFAG
jgi:hypothetical protein